MTTSVASTQGYTTSVIRGFGWQTILKIIGNLIALAKIMILARLLTPNDFGLFSLVMIALGVMEATTQTGVNTTILQSKHSVEYFLNTAWVIAIIRGIVISCLMIVMGLGMVRFYDQPELLFLVGIASLVPLIKGFINPMIVSLHKDLAFFADTLYRMSLVIAEALLSVVLVWLFGSIYAWVFALVLTAFFEVFISFYFFKTRPAFEFVTSRAQVIFTQAKDFAVSSLLSYLTENVDNLLIGKIVGSYGLGIYQPAYAIAHDPNYEIAKSAHHGTLPVYSKFVHDAPRLRRAFFRTLSTVGPATFVLSLPLLVFPQLVAILLGEQWQEAVPLLRFLAIAGLLQAVLMIFYSVIIAKKQLAVMNWQLALTFVIQVVGIIGLGSQFGLMGAVVAMILSRLLPLPFIVWATDRIIKS
jgi:O-antigen/teichoic acid export membrane protein